MTIDSALTALGQMPLSVHIAEDPVLFPWIELIHVLAITNVFGTILLVDLRLLGLAGRDYPVSSLSRALVPVTWIAFVIAAITGSLLFISNPITYFGNFYFRLKMLLMIAAGINMAIFHIWTMRGMRKWDTTPHAPFAVRAAGLISILIWLTVIMCGRWIGFTMAPF